MGIIFKVFLFSFCVFYVFFAKANDSIKNKNAEKWAVNLLQSMTLSEKIGQLYMMPVYGITDEAAHKAAENMVRKHSLGGLIFMQGTPERQAELTNRYQKAAKIPLFIAIDAEWGLGMRLEGAVNFPKNMMLGASNDPDLLEEFGRVLGKQCKRIGVNVNFAPVVDLNSNPKNPVIGVRSFGEDPYRVSLLAAAFGRGMQNEGILACMKHFPGHGDTDADSHYALPVIKKSREAIFSNEIIPFRALSEENFGAAMIAHLHIPALDSTKNLPSTLSQKIVKGILIDSLKFKGLIFTDAMNMLGLAKHHKAGEADLMALNAGNDILLFPLHLENGIKAVEEAVKTGKLSENLIDEKVKKILITKYKLGLSEYKPVSLENLSADLHRPEVNVLIEKMYAKSVIIAKNECSLLPFKKIENETFASLVIGAQKNNEFQKMLSQYGRFEHFSAQKYQNYDALFQKLSKKKTVVIGLFGLTEKAVSSDYGVSVDAKNFIKKLQDYTKVVVILFGNPYSLKFFEDSDYLICAHNSSKEAQKAVPQILFGAKTTKARMPVTASEGLPAGIGCDIAFMNRLSFSDYAEAAGLESKKMAVFEKMIEEGIKNRYMPGCQVLVARKGVVILNKGYGKFTYDKNSQDVTDETLYDLASVTKVLSVVPALMHLREKNRMRLEQPISDHLEDFCGTDKECVSVKQALAHQSSLYPYLPLGMNTIAEDGTSSLNAPNIGGEVNPFSEAMADEEFSAEAESMLWKWVIQSPVKKSKTGFFPYVYGDLPFLVLKKMAENLLKKGLDEFVEDKLSRPLGLNNLTYNPMEKIEQEKIAPTSYDRHLRKKITWGEVNDNAAALLGGVSGHAGLFSNAYDIAVYSQMLIQKGQYGSQKFFEEKTIKEFTARQFPYSRRGAGWDKAIPGNLQPAGKTAPAETFGHRGYTGTCFWVDPVNEIIFVFLCNRTYPNASNWKLNKSGLREQLNDLIHTAIIH